jgi:hypothetical protein
MDPEDLPLASQFLSEALLESAARTTDRQPGDRRSYSRDRAPGEISTGVFMDPDYGDFVLSETRTELGLTPRLSQGRPDNPYAHDSRNIQNLQNMLFELESLPPEQRSLVMQDLMENIPAYLNARTGFQDGGTVSPEDLRADQITGYMQEAIRVAEERGIPPGLFLLQMQKESGWDPEAVSIADAAGLSQITPDTAETRGLDFGRLTSDPVYSLESGADFLSELYDEYGSYPLALAGYNAGPGLLELSGPRGEYEPVPRRPETQNYVLDILAPFEEDQIYAREGRPMMRPRALPERMAYALALSEEPNPGRYEMDSTTSARDDLIRALYFERGPEADYDIVSRQYVDRPERPPMRPVPRP